MYVIDKKRMAFVTYQVIRFDFKWSNKEIFSFSYKENLNLDQLEKLTIKLIHSNYFIKVNVKFLKIETTEPSILNNFL